MKYDIGDIIHVKSNFSRTALDRGYTESTTCKNKIGEVIKIDKDTKTYHLYLIQFKEQVDWDISSSNSYAYIEWIREQDLDKLESLKLKKLLEV